jgi:tetratricopeptide (TPR) repeat protein
MSDRISNRSRWLIVVVAGVTVFALGLGAWLLRRPGHSPVRDVTYSLPPFSETPFLNSGRNARYVGIDACKECHTDNYHSYLHTAHSRALRDLDAATEPPDGTFEHKATGRSYRVYRQGTQFRHEEVLRTSEGNVIARVDLPIRYLIGSGNFTRSYIVEVDGFLHESPITWYSSRKTWDLSPGYADHSFGSFERPVKIRCLACHVGRVEPAEGSVQRMIFHEKAIGCENCHGPGSLHVVAHEAGKREKGAVDRTIVNPRRLSRSHLEAICAVCHLSGAAKTYLRGRSVNDFRPGMPLTDYRIDYRLAGGDEKMTVVGHVEQLRASACYQKSEKLTCLTCHDPHAAQKPKDATAFYRQKCLDCHLEQSCKLKLAERKKKDAADNCMRCHMPRGDTEIPHIAFTHHRIGRHPLATTPTSGPAQLVPIEDVSHLPAIDRQRGLGLAYLDLSLTSKGRTVSGPSAHLSRARVLLDEVYRAGLRDGATLQGLARVCWDLGDDSRAGRFAREALEAEDLLPEDRAIVLFGLARDHIRDRQLDAATDLLRQITQMRRYADDWSLLGQCHFRQGQQLEAVQALEQAVAIRPFSHELYSRLADVHLRMRNPERWSEYDKKARWLEKHLHP